MKKQSKYELFLELSKPDSEGFSRTVSIDEFVGKYSRLKMGNGGDWCRKSSTLGKKYNLKLERKDTNKVGKIIAISLQGYNKTSISENIPKEIRMEITKKPCAILAISDVQVDHKDGRKDDPRLNDPEKVILDDFQPLSQAANVAKRQHCKNCETTGNRFDAKRLGYVVSQVKGNGKYRGTCVGCYWHDPLRFNREASKHYKKEYG